MAGKVGRPPVPPEEKRILLSGVRVLPDTKERLKRLAASRGISMGKLIDQLIDQAMRQEHDADLA